VAWASLGPLEVTRATVRSRERVLFRARSVRDAKRLSSMLVRLRDLDPGARGLALQELSAQAFDVAATRARWKRLRLPVRLAALFGTLETLMLFVALPLLSVSPGMDEVRWLWAGGGLLG